MQQATGSAVEKTVGLDLGDRTSRYCILGPDGALVEQGRMATTEASLRRRFASMERARVAFEVGAHSPWVGRLVAECGHEVIAANPRQIRLIYENQRKSDRADAEYLARLARLDPKLLAPVTHRGEQAQADLALLRSRDMLVRTRADLVNHVRGAVKAVGQRVPKCSTPVFARRAEAHLTEPLEAALRPVLSRITQLNEQIHELDRRVEEIARKSYPETDVLRQVPGVGRGPNAAKAPGPGRSLHARPLRSRHGPQTLGRKARGTRRQEREETRDRGRRPETGRPAAQPVEHRGDLRAATPPLGRDPGAGGRLTDYVRR